MQQVLTLAGPHQQVVQIADHEVSDDRGHLARLPAHRLVAIPELDRLGQRTGAQISYCRGIHMRAIQDESAKGILATWADHSLRWRDLDPNLALPLADPESLNQCPGCL